MNKSFSYLLALLFFCLPFQLAAQTITDSSGKKIDIASVPDSRLDSVNRSVSPRKAAIRSAIIPGWGQVYVRKDMEGSFAKKYWKIPVIYGAIAVPATMFTYNITWYRRTRFAYKTLVLNDTSNFNNVHQKLQGFMLSGDDASLKYLRDEFRRDLDYSALFFLAMWGLNIVDASVDAHLKALM